MITYFDGHIKIVELLDDWMKERKLQLSCIVVAEFLVKAKLGEQKTLWKLIEQFLIIYLDQQILLKAVEIRKQMISKNKRIVMLDCLIAATAIVNAWTLVTRNVRDFKSISGLKLKVV